MNQTIIKCKNCNRTASIIEFSNEVFNTCPYCGLPADETESEICIGSPQPGIFTDLDSFQIAAVFATEGAVRVIAGAGSGKTAVLTNRIALIANMMKCCSKSIFAITFTKKAANEMKERLARLMRSPAYVNTIHGMCADILKSEAGRTPFADFQIIDQNDKKAILGDIFEELELDKSFSSQDELVVEFSKMKNKNPYYYIEMLCSKTSEDLTEAANAEIELVNKAFLLYLKHQRLLKFLDFDDLILLTLYIMTSHPEVLAKWQNIIRYMHVDEFQDISKNEFELIRLLSEKSGNLFVVGDPDQNIYTWRGSCLEYLNDFNRYFLAHRDFILNFNYRSVPAIINVSNALIKNNISRVSKLAIPVRSDMTCIKVHRANDSYDEIEYIVKEIKLKMNFSNSINLSDFGILYRSSNEFRFIESVLRRNQLPYYAPCGTSFFDRKEIKDIHSYLRFMVCRDDVSFSRIINVPKRGIGKSKLELVRTHAKENKTSLYEALVALQDSDKFTNTSAKEFIDMFEAVSPVCNNMTVLNLVEKILCVSGYEEWLKSKGQDEEIGNLDDLKRMISEYERGESMPISEYLKTVALYAEKSTKDEKNAVQVLTLHGSKGLQFKTVFICGMNDGLIPYGKATGSRDELEEQRRLVYVGMTRAEDELHLTYSKYVFGANRAMPHSRFIDEISDVPCISFSESPSNYYNDAGQFFWKK